MDLLPELVQCAVHLDLGLADRCLGGVDRVRQEVAPLLDARGIAAFLEFNPLRLQKVAQVAEQFVFLDGFHNSRSMLPPAYRTDLPSQ